MKKTNESDSGRWSGNESESGNENVKESENGRENETGRGSAGGKNQPDKQTFTVYKEKG